MTGFASPYARALGLVAAPPDGRVMLTMPFGDHLLGRPGFLHGGAIAGLLENAAWATTLAALEGEGATLKPVSITVDFLRGGKMIDTFAAARIVRLGRRIAVVTASAWQDDEANPIAQANLKLMLSRP